jgi:hypothetical protein
MPTPMSHASAPNVFAFPYAAPSNLQKEPPKQKWKNNKKEFQCVFEKERVLRHKSGPTKHSYTCKMKCLKERAFIDLI